MKWAEITKRCLPIIWPFYGGARHSIAYSQACAVFGGVEGVEGRIAMWIIIGIVVVVAVIQFVEWRGRFG